MEMVKQCLEPHEWFAFQLSVYAEYYSEAMYKCLAQYPQLKHVDKVLPLLRLDPSTESTDYDLDSLFFNLSSCCSKMHMVKRCFRNECSNDLSGSESDCIFFYGGLMSVTNKKGEWICGDNNEELIFTIKDYLDGKFERLFVSHQLPCRLMCSTLCGKQHCYIAEEGDFPSSESYQLFKDDYYDTEVVTNARAYEMKNERNFKIVDMEIQLWESKKEIKQLQKELAELKAKKKTAKKVGRL